MICCTKTSFSLRLTDGEIVEVYALVITEESVKGSCKTRLSASGNLIGRATSRSEGDVLSSRNHDTQVLELQK